MNANTEMKNLNELNLDDLEAVTGGVDKEKDSRTSTFIEWIISLFD